MLRNPETPFLQRLRKTYHAPDGKVVERYNGSIFEPSSVFVPALDEKSEAPGSSRSATTAEIQAIINKAHQK